MNLYNFLTYITILLVTNNVTLATDNLLDNFKEWIIKHKIQIENDNEYTRILNNWIDNNKYIKYVNSLNKPYKLNHNSYSGMTHQEFSNYMNFKLNNKELAYNINNLDNILSTDFTDYIPQSVDWRTKGAVTPVKDQGQCGSCWSFSNTGSLEGAYYIKYGDLISFSEQELVDCSNLKNGGPNMGCNGGQISQTMDWIGKNGGLCTEDAYPYTSGTTKTIDSCKSSSCISVSKSKVISHTNVAPNSDNDMMVALINQPVSVGIEADQRDFQLYSSGVFTNSCGTDIDHAVLLVGYGFDNVSNLNYYIIKNSWSTSWGEQGYIYLGKDTDQFGKSYNSGKGQCGVLMMGSYPNI